MKTQVCLPKNSDRLPNLNVHLLSRRITCMTVPAIVEAIHTACVTKKKITLAHYNVHGFNLSMQLPWFYNFLQGADITHCDGSGILKGISYMGLNLPIQYRASYTALMPELLKHCDRHGFSIFLLGSKPQYLEIALSRLSRQYPNIKFAGHHGYFAMEDPNQNDEVIRQINSVKPHILLVGMGMPIQENWVRLHRSYLNVNAIMCGGAIIDRLAGVVPDCPPFLSNLALEWVYRLYREPKRLAARYLLGNPAFLFHIALAKLYQHSFRVEYMQFINEDSQQVKHNLRKLFSTSISQNDFSAAIDNNAKQLGDHLVEAGILTQTQVETALYEQEATGIGLSEVLLRKGWLNQQTIKYFMEKMILLDSSLPRESSKYTEMMSLS